MGEPIAVDIVRRATVAVRMTVQPVRGDDPPHSVVVRALREATDAFEKADDGPGGLRQVAGVDGAPSSCWLFVSRDAAGNEASFVVEVGSQCVPDADGVQAGATRVS